jgi:F-type H+-transporting ATPase subunit epsilon
VTILSDSAELEEDIDVARARAAKERAETQMRTENSAEVEADLRRAHARLSAAGGLGSGH